MEYYFQLQYKRFQRWLKEIGLPFYVGIGLMGIGFFLISKIVCRGLGEMNWVYGFAAMSFLFPLSEKTRNYHLQTLFESSDYYTLRCLENGVAILPVLLFALYDCNWFAIPIALVLGIVLAFYKEGAYWNKVIPTPFKKMPFEMIVGFRRMWGLVAIIYFVVLQAILVDNYNLGGVMMLGIFFSAMGFYAKPEDSYFVWIYNNNAIGFLKKKIIWSWLCISMLVLPVFLALGIFFPSQIATTLVIYVGGHILLTSMILAKYAVFPSEMNLPQAFLYGLSIVFFPFLLVMMWVFFKKAKSRLELFL